MKKFKPVPEAPIEERRIQEIFAARSARVGAGMCDVFGRTLPSSVVSVLFRYIAFMIKSIPHVLNAGHSYLSPSDIVNLHCVSKKFRGNLVKPCIVIDHLLALLRSPQWMELVVLFSIPLTQWLPIHGRYGNPDWRERKLNLGQDQRWPNRGRLLLTYKRLLSEEVDFDDEDSGYSIDEKLFVRFPPYPHTHSPSKLKFITLDL